MEYTLEQLELLLKQNEEQEEEINKSIDKLCEDKSILWDKHNKWEKLYNELKYKDIKVELGVCYYKQDKHYSYHDIKSSLIIVDDINSKGNYIIREFVVKDDDGDEFFYIKHYKDYERSKLMEYIGKQEYKQINKEEANDLLAKWVEI